MSGATIRRLHSRSQSTEALLVALSHNPVVEYAEPNYIVHAIATPNDPRYSELWGMRNTGQIIQGFAGTAGADIKAEGAWDVSTGSRTIVVGVVDTGIDYTHQDLSGNTWSNPGGIGGCAAGTHGYNAITKSCDPRDDQYHGTHVSGTIGAAGNNALGVVGVNWTTSIMGLKFLDSVGSGTTADAISAIDFSVNAKIAGVNVRVLSNSWGGGGFSQALLDEINKAGRTTSSSSRLRATARPTTTERRTTPRAITPITSWRSRQPTTTTNSLPSPALARRLWTSAPRASTPCRASRATSINISAALRWPPRMSAAPPLSYYRKRITPSSISRAS